jgi:transmembrane sensor
MEELIIKYLHKKTNQTEREELFSWIAQDQENEKQYIRLKKVYALTSVMDDADESKAWRKIQKRSFRSRQIKKLGISILKYAAILILSFIGYTQLDLSTKETAITYHYVAAEGNQINFITLSDGSKIWLNPGSVLRIPSNFSKENRQVHIEGQGYFEIFHNDLDPFVVQLNDERIRVLGTKFNVNAYHPDYLELTLVEGRIQLYSKQQQVSELMPGEKLLFRYDDHSIEREWLENTDFYSSWRSGNLQFDNIRLTSILELLETWYSVEFFLNNPEIGEIPFTGTLLKEEGLDQALKLIRSSSNLQYRKSKKENKFIIKFY